MKRTEKAKTGRGSWRWSVAMKTIAVLAAVAIVFLVAYTVIDIFFGKGKDNFVDLSYGSVSYELEEGETFRPDGTYEGVDIFGRLNWKFARQKKWYGEMTADVNTSIAKQHVETYKQYSNNILVSADISTGLVKKATQFCYVKNDTSKDMGRVLWRNPAENPPYSGINTKWKTNELPRNMTIRDFKAKYGLPAYELSVYVIRPETVLSFEDLIDNGDGTWTIAYQLNPQVWESEDGSYIEGAPSYYGNQMKFSSGGMMKEAPNFKAIRISFTFDENWQVYSSDVQESYSAVYGVEVQCSYSSHTVYEYNTDRADSSDFDDFFSDYLEGPTTGGDEGPTAADCLVSFATGLLGHPTSLALDLNVGGTKTDGVIWLDTTDLDISVIDMENFDIAAVLSQVEVRARIGETIRLWLDDDVYLAYGGMKGKLGVSELMAFMGELTASPTSLSEEETEDGDNDLLSAFTKGEFTYGDGRATLLTKLPVGDAVLPVNFYFFLDKKNNATLDRITLEMEFNGTPIVAEIRMGEEVPSALEESDKASSAALIPYAEALLDLISSSHLHIDLNYTQGGVVLDGGIDFNLNTYAISGYLTVTSAQNASLYKTVRFANKDGDVLVDLDGIKLRADALTVAGLISGYVNLSESSGDASLDLETLIANVLDPAFASIFASSEEENTLLVALKGTELLGAFGAEFALGDVNVGISEGELALSALGFGIVVTKGEAFTVDKEGYLDINPFIVDLAEIFAEGYIQANVAYGNESFSAEADLTVDLKAYAAEGDILIGYKEAKKLVHAIYADEIIYLDIDGIKISAPISEATELLAAYLSVPAAASEELGVIERILSLNFAEVIGIDAADGELAVVLKGTELLKAFGISFDLGDVSITVSKNLLTVEALGVYVAAQKGEAFTVGSLEEYVAILPHLRNVIALFSEEYFALDIAYGEEGADWRVAAKLDLDPETLLLGGTGTVTYKTASKTFGILYGEKVVYLDLDGIRISADIESAAALIRTFVAESEPEALADETDDVVEKLLSLDFGKLLSIETENEALIAVLQSNELLAALGVDFELGEVTAKVEEGKITATALGICVVVTCGKEPQAADPDRYVELVPYAESVAELLRSELLHIDANYSAENSDFTAKATIELDLNALEAAATVTLGYKSAEKTIFVNYTDEVLYLELDGIKISAEASEAVALVAAYLGLPDGASEEIDLIECVLSLNFSEFLQISEQDSTLLLAVKGTELLKALHLDFTVGDVLITVGGDKVTATLLGTELTVSKGTQRVPAIDAEEYIDILPYVRTVIALLSEKYLALEVSYGAEGDLWRVSAQLDLEPETLLISGTAIVTYKETSKAFGIIYGDGVVYLTLDGMNISADVDEAADLIRAFVANVPAREAEEGEEDAIEKLLSLDFGKLLSLGVENGALKAVLQSNALLEALGVDYELGEVNVTVAEKSISASALGVKAVITYGAAPAVANPEDYINILPYANQIAEILRSRMLHADIGYATKDGAFTVRGTLDINVEDLEAVAILTMGYRGAEKPVEIRYTAGMLYLDLEGVKIAANVQDAIELVSAFLVVPFSEEEGDEADIIEKLLSLNFADFLALAEEDDTLLLAVKGTELLTELGLGFALGNVDLSVGDGKITAKALGAEVSVEKTDAVELGSLEDYIDILPHIGNVIALFTQDYLHAKVDYSAGKLIVGAELDLDLFSLAVSGNISLTYGEAQQQIYVVYGNGVVYLTLDDIRISASVERAVELVFAALGIENSTEQERDLVESLFSLNFGDVLSLETTSDALKLSLAGGKLLKAFGIDFELGDTEIVVGTDRILASALGVDVLITEGAEPVSVNPEDYIDVMPYASAIADMILGGYIAANATYSAGALTVKAYLDISLSPVAAQGTLVLFYGGAEKAVDVVYTEEYLYLTIDEIKVRANVRDSIEILLGLFGKQLDNTAEEERDLLERVLSLGFGDLLDLAEIAETEGSYLRLAVKGSELLEALGFTFELGDVTVQVSKNGELEISAHGAELALKAREEFALASTEGFIDILPYVETVLEFVHADWLMAEVAYTSDALHVEGSLYFGREDLILKAELTVTYGSASKAITVYYGEGDVYLAVQNIKVRASVEEAVGLIGNFVAIPKTDIKANELLAKVLGLTFDRELLELGEDEDLLTVAINGTKLLSALGLAEFDLGNVALGVDAKDKKISASALGAEVIITVGSEFVWDTEGYVNLMPYAETVASLILGNFIAATVRYESDSLVVFGEVYLDIIGRAAYAELTVCYGKAEKALSIIYHEDIAYLSVDGLYLKAAVKEIASLVGEYVDIPKTDFNANEILERAFAADLSALVGMEEDIAEGKLTLSVDGTMLLAFFGIDFALGEVQLDIKGGKLKVEAFVLGGKVTLGLVSTEAFESTPKEEYIDVIPYAKTVVDLINGGFLHATGSYSYGGLTLGAEIDFDIENIVALLSLNLKYHGKPADGKLITVIYVGDEIYLDVDGIKLSVTTEELLEIVKEYAGVAPDDLAANELLEALLSENFSELIKELHVTEEGTLSCAVAGTKILKMLGVNFDLGDVRLAVTESEIKVSAEVFGNALALTVSEGNSSAFEKLDLSGYVVFDDYAEVLLKVFLSGIITADIFYVNQEIGFTVKASVDLAFKPFAVAATIELTYGKAGKTIKAYFEGGIVYLTLCEDSYDEAAGDLNTPIKVSAKLTEAIELVKEFISLKDVTLDEVIEAVLSTDFSALIPVFEETRKGTVLSMAIAVDELLEQLEIPFSLGEEILLTVKKGDDCVRAELSDTIVQATIRSGEAFVCDTEGYVDIVPYAWQIIDLVRSNYIDVTVDYTAGGLDMVGVVSLSLDPIFVSAKLTLKYGKVDRTIGIAYGSEEDDSYIYLTVYNADNAPLKLKATFNEARDLIVSLLPDSIETDIDALDLLDWMLRIDLVDLVSLREEVTAEGAGLLRVTLHGNAILRALGVPFDLNIGSLDITLSEGAISIRIGKATLSVSKGEKIDFNAEDYRDLTPVFEKIARIFDAKGFVFAVEYGAIEVAYENEIFVLDIRKGAVSWENGIEIYLDCALVINGNEIFDFCFSISVNTEDLSDSTVKFATEEFGVVFRLSDIGQIAGKLKEIGKRVGGVFGRLVGKSAAEPEEGEVESYAAISAPIAVTAAEEHTLTSTGVLGAVLAAVPMVSALADLDWQQFVQDIVLGPSEKAGGILMLRLGGFTLDLYERLDENGFIGSEIHYRTSKLDIYGDMYLDFLGDSFPEISEDGFYSVDDLLNLIDYISATVGVFGQQNFNASVYGDVLDADGSLKYEYSATLNYTSGKNALFLLNVDDREIRVNTDLYLHFALDLKSYIEGEDSLYLDILVLDADEDEVLDYYVSVSKFAADHEAYKPLAIHVPASEISAVLKDLLALFGVDEYLDSMIDFSELQTRGQLRALGKFAMSLVLKELDFGNIFESLFGSIGNSSDGDDTENVPELPAAKWYLKSFNPNGDTLEIILRDKGEAALDDIAITVTKGVGEDGLSVLTGLTLTNVWNRARTEFMPELNVEINQNEIDRTVEGNYISFSGIHALIEALARSATHGVTDEEIISGEAKEHEYLLNKNFYIDGTLNASVLGIVDVEIELIAVSVTIDENGELGINARLSYQGKRVLVVAINGDTTLDLTIKGGMVYMKRVQTTDFNGGWLGTSERDIAPITLYRAMPMESFMADILNQMSFMLNFGSVIADQIKNAGNSGSGGEGEGGETTATVYDYGAILTGFKYAKDGDNESWNVTVDGTSFSDGMLGNLPLVITAENGLLRNIVVQKTSVAIPVTDSFKLSISFSANLRWRNAGGTFEVGSSNQTDSTIADAIRDYNRGMGAMIDKLNADGWSEGQYLEARPISVNYYINEVRNGGEAKLYTSQQVLLSTGNETSGYPVNTFYGSHFEHIDPAALNDDEYTYSWAVVPEEYELGMVIQATGDAVNYYLAQTINTYTVKFYSDRDLDLDGYDDWREVNIGGVIWYVYDASMQYNAEIYIEGQGTYRVVGEAEYYLTDESASYGIRAAHWASNPQIDETGAAFTVEYDPDVIQYYSVISYWHDGREWTSDDPYTIDFSTTIFSELIVPVAEGYVFLGWYRETENGWEEVTQVEIGEAVTVHTLHALWREGGSASLQSTRRDYGYSQKILWTTVWVNEYYTYDSAATISAVRLWGAFAADAILEETEYRYSINGEEIYSKTYEGFVAEDRTGEINCNKTNENTMSVNVFVKYRYNDVEFLVQLSSTAAVTNGGQIKTR